MSTLREQMANLINQPPRPPLASSDEERPLLRSFPNPSRYGPQIPIIKLRESSLWARVQEYLNSDIDTRWAELQLIVSFFISGMIDAGAYNAYECFCSMQVRSAQLAFLILSRSIPLIRRPDRQHNLRRPRCIQPSRLLPKTRLDKIRCVRSRIPIGLRSDSILPPHLRRSQTLGPLLLVPRPVPLDPRGRRAGPSNPRFWRP